ncbi:MAG TPA: citrate (Si)-synthase [Anaerolineaceae bacterium]
MASDNVVSMGRVAEQATPERNEECHETLCEKISAQLPGWRERVRKLLKENGETQVSGVTVDQIYGGLRGVITQVSDISYVDPLEGLRLRGYTIPGLLEMLPRAGSSCYPLAGGLYYLLMIDRMPTLSDALQIESEWKARAEIPAYVIDMLRAMPRDTHPMALFSMAILALEPQSVFPRRYGKGLPKPIWWQAILEDSLNLTAKLPALAGFIYNLKYRDGELIAPDPNLDWSANFGHMIGRENSLDFLDLCRLFFVLHCDHEGGNVSAHAATLVGSGLSDVYYSCSAAMDGLAGPLHGLANQDCLSWLLALRREFHHFPTQAELERYSWDALQAGKVIPGYGHAVLRRTDPRFTALLAFGKQHTAEDELFKLVEMNYQVLPGILKQLGKVKNPYPNVDAVSGSLLFHYGLREFDFYTVLFGVSRILGLTANAVWSRALYRPIERPKSVTTAMLEDIVAGGSIDEE